MGRLAQAEDIWFHVDAAYGGFALLSRDGDEMFRGIEMADSVTLDPHKWLFQPYETGCLMVRDTRGLEDTFRILPEYLQDVNLGQEHVNFADRGIQLSRRFRALKIWMSIQTLGLGAFREAIQEAIDLAGEAAKYIEASPVLELLGPSSLGIVCFRYRPVEGQLDEKRMEGLNARIQDEVVDTGLAMISSTRLRGTYSLRLSILNYRSTWEDVVTTLKGIEEIGRRFCEGSIDA
jgi:glutamate/tyrosine decarboxylase-like PLP-dependent enzyme